MKKMITNVIYLTISLFTLSCSSPIKPLSIGYWNVENLFDIFDDPIKNDEEFSIGGRKNVTQEIYELKIQQSAEVLRDLNVDVLGLSEVENAMVLEDLNFAYKERNYKIIHFDSPDERGIDNALLYDPNYFKVVSSKPIPNTLPSGDKTRDILYVKGLYADELIHLLLKHWRSNYGRREKTITKREATAQLQVREI